MESTQQEGLHHSSLISQPGIFDSEFKNAQQGYFHHLDSTNIYLASSKANLRQKTNLTRLPITSIKSLQFKKKGGGLIGAFSGMIAGGLTGLLLGRSAGKNDDCTITYTNEVFLIFPIRIAHHPPFPCGPSEKGRVSAVKGALVGAALGLIVGSCSKRTFHIGGQKSNARLQEEAINKFKHNQ
ncbi:MAG: outer membrane lipoprotein SlyB [Neolewinella sp.]|jgi:outer membrane lipoprotein SlyB